MADDPPLYRQVAAELLIDPFGTATVDTYQALPVVEPVTAPTPIVGGADGHG